jgi:hypothetical protein
MLVVFGLAEGAQRGERAGAQVCCRVHSLWLRAPRCGLRGCDEQDTMIFKVDINEVMFAMSAPL